MRTLTTIGALLCAATLTAGCSTVDGRAEPEDPTASDPAFDPCDDIPDDAIRAIGMDPATESRDILGVHQPGWNLCGWNNSTRFLTVYATNRGLDEIRASPDYEGVTPVDLLDRDGFSFHDANSSQSRCDIATTVRGGTAMFSLSVSSPVTDTGDVCAEALNVARRLLPALPR